MLTSCRSHAKAQQTVVLFHSRERLGFDFRTYLESKGKVSKSAGGLQEMVLKIVKLRRRQYDKDQYLRNSCVTLWQCGCLLISLGNTRKQLLGLGCLSNGLPSCSSACLKLHLQVACSLENVYAAHYLSRIKMSAPMQKGFVDNALPTESGKPPVWSYNVGVRVQLQCSECRTEMKNKSRADVSLHSVE